MSTNSVISPKNTGELEIASLINETILKHCGGQLTSVPFDVRFRDQGIESAAALRILADLSQRLGRPLRPTLWWQFPTLRELSRYWLTSAFPKFRQVRVFETRGLATVVTEPVALVGIACRFPSEIDSPTAFWEALERGHNGVSEVPIDRWSVDRWHDKDPLAPGKMTTRWGGFLRDVSLFDAGFFRLSPREATQMDPQQRLMLEAAWEALEDAGIVPAELYGSAASVFVGAMWQDYPQVSGVGAELIEQHSAAGWNNSIIPARIAYLLGLRGPAVTVNTACSSSLVAVHLACSSLRNGECDTALAGAVNLMLTPQTTVQMTKFGSMNPEGECRAFDADANGYVRGEGCAVVVLKRLRDALGAGDRIYAVIRGSSINNDGPSNGLTAPSVEAQVAVLQTAWIQAGVPPRQSPLSRLTARGPFSEDPIEASALGEVFAPGRVEPLQIGSVKYELGTPRGCRRYGRFAQGDAVALSWALPRNLHFCTPNPHIDFEALDFRVVNDREGFSVDVDSLRGGKLFWLRRHQQPYCVKRSARAPAASGGAGAADHVDELRAQAKTLAGELLDVRTDAELDKVATRSHGTGSIRAFLTGRHPDEFQKRAASAFRSVNPILQRSGGTGRDECLFGGQGGQWAGMVQDLLNLLTQRFRDTLRFAMQPSGLMDDMVDPEALALPVDEGANALGSVDRIQVLVFGVQVALARTLMDWGLVPNAVIGQSLGQEAAAAVVSGASSAGRRRAGHRHPKPRCGDAYRDGGMAVVDLTLNEAEDILATLPEISVACPTCPARTNWSFRDPTLL